MNRSVAEHASLDRFSPQTSLSCLKTQSRCQNCQTQSARRLQSSTLVSWHRMATIIVVAISYSLLWAKSIIKDVKYNDRVWRVKCSVSSLSGVQTRVVNKRSETTHNVHTYLKLVFVSYDWRLPQYLKILRLALGGSGTLAISFDKIAQLMYI